MKKIFVWQKEATCLIIALLLWVLLPSSLLPQSAVQAFVVPVSPVPSCRTLSLLLQPQRRPFLYTVLHATPPPPPPVPANIRDIKDELRQLRVNFDDCFDKESLVQRLQEAREGQVKATTTTTTTRNPTEPTNKTETETSSTTLQSTTPTTTTTTDTSSAQETQQPSSPFPTDEKEQQDQQDQQQQQQIDPQTILAELRALPVKELRQELATRHVRWAGYLEKKDLVQAVWDARQVAANFSVTGLMIPGQVTALTGPQVQAEAQESTLFNKNDDTQQQQQQPPPAPRQRRLAPLLVDAYATWCGPCQIMAPQLQAAAAEWGDQIRVTQLDTDAHPKQASAWKIQGLPTLLLFRQGKLVARIEGALMKDQLLQWVETELAKL